MIISEIIFQILQRATVDRFILDTSRCLGPLRYFRIWHDNSGIGTGASWYLDRVVVTDLSSQNK